jgi:putative phosphoribosyl transferase
MSFQNRHQAGKLLGSLLRKRSLADPIVLALPRGGVPVGEEVARALDAPLEVLVARKLGLPWNPEVGFGAIAEGGGTYLNDWVVQAARLTTMQINRTIELERAELVRRVLTYRGDRPLPDLHGRTAIVVDDGIATGGTIRAALRSVRQMQPDLLVLAVPVLPREQLYDLQSEADEVCFVQAPIALEAVGAYYDDFSPTSDAEVLACLTRASARLGDADSVRPHPVAIPIEGGSLEGELEVPPDARGVVVFAHGNGSGRSSPRNRYVARQLRLAGMATLLLDLLTEDERQNEEQNHESDFDGDLLAGRLIQATRWLKAHPETAPLPLGFFGSSTGAAVALIAASVLGKEVAAVVSRGGRPELASETQLGRIEVPTLFIVGGEDRQVLALNQLVQKHLRGRSQLVIVPGAGHLFEGPGELETVSEVTSNWFLGTFLESHVPRHEATLG